LAALLVFAPSAAAAETKASSAEIAATGYVSISADDGNGSCSGVLITTTRVATAAHCLQGARSIRVKLGVSNPGGGRTVRALRWKRAPNAAVYDIGFIDIAAPRAGERRRPVPVSRRTTSPSAGSMAWQIGYTGGGSRQIRSTPIRTGTWCDPNFNSRVMLCAGYVDDPNSPCAGDSGSPLFFNGAVIGILTGYARGEFCGDYPFLYTQTFSAPMRRFLGQ
jgi:hypothetical protein